jgi:hypothetical protein
MWYFSEYPVHETKQSERQENGHISNTGILLIAVQARATLQIERNQKQLKREGNCYFNHNGSPNCFPSIPQYSRLYMCYM